MPQREWIQLYGGPALPDDSSSTLGTGSGDHERSPSGGDEDGKHEKSATEPSDPAPSAAGSSGTGAIKRLKGAGFGLLGVHGHKEKEKDDDTASIHSVRKGPIRGMPNHSDFKFHR